MFGWGGQRVLGGKGHVKPPERVRVLGYIEQGEGRRGGGGAFP